MIKRHGRTSSRPSTPIHCAGEVCRSELELKDLAFCIGSHDLGIAGRMPGQSRFIPGASSFETERNGSGAREHPEGAQTHQLVVWCVEKCNSWSV